MAQTRARNRAESDAQRAQGDDVDTPDAPSAGGSLVENFTRERDDEEPYDPAKADAPEGDGEEDSDAKYVVAHAAINLWDPEVELKEAKKERLIKRFFRGHRLTDDDLKHADKRKIEQLLELRAIVKIEDLVKPEHRQIPAGTTGMNVPEAAGPTVPLAH